MAVYTVHEPPTTRSDARRGPEAFEFVRDGFYVWAFLLTPLWLLYRRLWLAFLVYAVVVAGIGLGLGWLRVGLGNIVVAQLLLSSLVALEAGTLLRRKLQWWKWRDVGLVSGRKIADAEQRFFDQWKGEATAAVPPAQPAAYPIDSPAQTMRPRAGHSDIVGLFPEPGTPR